MLKGVYENCIGTTDGIETLRYWAELGYQVVAEGQLAAQQAGSLYAYASGLQSWRLQNGLATDHGLVRVMQWETPHNAGLEYAPPLAIGSRWFAAMTADIFMLRDAYADDVTGGGRWDYSEPARAIIMTGQPASSFYQRFVGVREMVVLGEQTRHAFFQRYGYERPGYGAIDPASPLQVSEGTHSSFVTADHAHASFYTEVMGLKPSVVSKTIGQQPATRAALMMQEGQDEALLSNWESDCEAGVGLFQVYTPLYPSPDLRDHSQPGSLGLSLFTYRTAELATLYTRVQSSPATAVTGLLSNEFNEASFGFLAPDGMYWVIIGE